MTQLPDELEYGFVRSRILLAVADTPADEDHYPDAQAAQGTVRFAPSRSVIRGADEPVFVIKRNIEVGIAEDADTAAEIRKGDLIHNGRPGVWLVTGTYTVRFQLGDVAIEPFQIHVTPEHTEAAPLWLSLAAPLVPSPDVKFVVNEQVYLDTLAASESAQSSASDAEAAASDASASADAASDSADAASVAADRAESVPFDLATPTTDGIMSAADKAKLDQVHPVRVDTTAGTAVHVTGPDGLEHLVSYDSGWRALCRWSDGVVTEGTLPTGLAPQGTNAGGVYVLRTLANVTVAVVEADVTQRNPQITLPVGFRGKSGIPFPAIPIFYRDDSLRPQIANAEFGSSGFVRYRDVYEGATLSAAGTGGYGVMATAPASPSLPTTLPGTPA